ncbi:VWA domain-containing protein [Paenarthrobacter sp. NPDC090520]|uniref:vWA domain-containing protein n=1 Tax=Paenarthrobacter sp. NPDC090520 TaxID=3364382 RepID=UPI00382CEAEA
MTLAPIIPWPFIALAGVAVVAFVAWTVFTRKQPQPLVRQTALRAAAVVLLLVAALRPGWPGDGGRTAVTDLDVFFVVDTSTSMAAEDYRGSGMRLAGVQEDVLGVAKELAGAKFSLITFDSGATVRMPLSQDATALQTAVATLQPQNPRYAAGSSITEAGALLKKQLAAAKEKHPGRPAVVFYAGDGENTAASGPERLPLDPSVVNGGAVLGYGTSDGGRMKDPSDPKGGYVKDKNAEVAVSKIDEDALRTIATQLGVPYVHRTGSGGTEEMLGKAKPGVLVAVSDDGSGRLELYWLLALAAFLILVQEPFRHATALRALRGSGTRERGLVR